MVGRIGSGGAFQNDVIDDIEVLQTSVDQAKADIATAVSSIDTIAPSEILFNGGAKALAYLDEADADDIVDGVVRLDIESMTSVLPVTATDGQMWIVPASDPINSSHIGKLARWDAITSTFMFLSPVGGWEAYVKDNDEFRDYSTADGWRIRGTNGNGQLADLFAEIDERVLGFAKVNGHGGGLFRAHWTASGIVITGDGTGLRYDTSGDNSREFHVPWDSVNNGKIVEIYAGQNYLLIISDNETGNAYHMGATDYGQGGNGLILGTKLLPRQITKFDLDGVKITKFVTESNRGNTEKFWFAITTTGVVYGCGYSGAQHVMGYNNTANLSTPRVVTFSDGMTPVAVVTDIVCDSAYSPIWAILDSGKAVRWGARTNGAHGNNNILTMPWPSALQTTPGSGVHRTDIASISVAGGNTGFTSAVTWLLTKSGKIEVAGAQDYGIGDAATIAPTNAITFAPAAGIISTKFTSSIHAGGGRTPNCVAITNDGNAYICGYMGASLRGDGLVSNLNIFTILASLPSGFAGGMTDCKNAGGYNGGANHVIYIEATIDGKKRIATCGYDVYYNTARGQTGIPVASRSYGVVVGVSADIDSYQSVGNGTIFGIEVLDINGRLWYAGGNDKGQGGVGHTRSVIYLQPCISGPRIAKTLTTKGRYSEIVNYHPLDVTIYDGSSWECLAQTTGNSPPTLPTQSNTYWRLVASKGDDGVLFDWTGPWVTGTAYSTQQGAANVGASYVCIVEHTASATSEPGVGATWASFWDLSAAQGGKGDEGPGGINAIYVQDTEPVGVVNVALWIRSTDGQVFQGITGSFVDQSYSVQGLPGTSGAGFPSGGKLGQLMTKLSTTDYDANWSDIDVTAGVREFNETNGLATDYSGGGQRVIVSSPGIHVVKNTDINKVHYNFSVGQVTFDVSGIPFGAGFRCLTRLHISATTIVDAGNGRINGHDVSSNILISPSSITLGPGEFITLWRSGGSDFYVESGYSPPRAYLDVTGSTIGGVAIDWNRIREPDNTWTYRLASRVQVNDVATNSGLHTISIGGDSLNSEYIVRPQVLRQQISVHQPIQIWRQLSTNFTIYNPNSAAITSQMNVFFTVERVTH